MPGWGPELAAHLQPVNDFAPVRLCGGRLDADAFKQRAYKVTEAQCRSLHESEAFENWRAARHKRIRNFKILLCVAPVVLVAVALSAASLVRPVAPLSGHVHSPPQQPAKEHQEPFTLGDPAESAGETGSFEAVDAAANPSPSHEDKVESGQECHAESECASRTDPGSTPPASGSGDSTPLADIPSEGEQHSLLEQLWAEPTAELLSSQDFEVGTEQQQDVLKGEPKGELPGQSLQVPLAPAELAAAPSMPQDSLVIWAKPYLELAWTDWMVGLSVAVSCTGLLLGVLLFCTRSRRDQSSGKPPNHTAPAYLVSSPLKEAMRPPSSTSESDSATSLIPASPADPQQDEQSALACLQDNPLALAQLCEDVELAHARVDKLEEVVDELSVERDELQSQLLTTEQQCLYFEQERDAAKQSADQRKRELERMAIDHTEVLAVREVTIDQLKRALVMEDLAPLLSLNTALTWDIIHKLQVPEPSTMEERLAVRAQQTANLRAEVATLRARLYQIEVSPTAAPPLSPAADLPTSGPDFMEVIRLLGEVEEERDSLLQQVHSLREQTSMEASSHRRMARMLGQASQHANNLTPGLSITDAPSTPPASVSDASPFSSWGFLGEGSPASRTPPDPADGAITWGHVGDTGPSQQGSPLPGATTVFPRHYGPPSRPATPTQP